MDERKYEFREFCEYIMYKVSLHIDDIYWAKIIGDMIDAINFRKIDRSIDLLDVCLETCDALFHHAHEDNGKKPKNIPDVIVDSMAEILQKYRHGGFIHDEAVSLKKYEAATSYDMFKDSEHISMEDLLRSIDRDEGIIGINRDDSLKLRREELKSLYTKFMVKFFGERYIKNNDREVKYEALRLTKILYDLKHKGIGNGNIILERLLSFPAYMGYSKMPYTYRMAVLYIKSRLILRAEQAHHAIDYDNIIRAEKYCDALMNFCKTFCDKCFEYAYYRKNGREDPRLSCEEKRKCQSAAIKLLVDRFAEKKEELRSYRLEHINNADAIQLYSYIVFTFREMLWGYKNESDFSFLSPDIDMPAQTYDEIYDCDGDEECSLYDGSKAKELFRKAAMLLYEKDMLHIYGQDAANDKKVWSKRINRHMDEYIVTAKIYNICHNKANEAPIKMREAMMLIWIFETLKQYGIKLPRWAGYQMNGNTGARKKVSIITIIKEFHPDVYNAHDKYDESDSMLLYWMNAIFKLYFSGMTVCVFKEMMRYQNDLFNLLADIIPPFDGAENIINVLIENLFPRGNFDAAF